MEEIKIDFPVPSLEKLPEVKSVCIASAKCAPWKLVLVSCSHLVRRHQSLTFAHVTIPRLSFHWCVDVLDARTAVYFLKSGDRVSQPIWHGSSEGSQSKGICASVCACEFSLRLAPSSLRLQDNHSLLRSTRATHFLCISVTIRCVTDSCANTVSRVQIPKCTMFI